MSKIKSKISYDKESQVLSLEVQKAKSVDSDIQNNVVIDYDKNGKVVRINIYAFNFDNFKNGAKALRSFAKVADVLVSVK